MVTKSSGVRKVKESISMEMAELEALVARMNSITEHIARRAYEIFASESYVVGHDVEHWLRAESELFHPVHLHIVETEQSIDVNAEVPGFSETELKVNIHPHWLTITGKREIEKKPSKTRAIHSDVCASEIFRMIRLPAEVKAGKATAKLKNGILSLSIPKAEKVKVIRQAA